MSSGKLKQLIEEGKWPEFEEKLVKARQQPGSRAFTGKFSSDTHFPWGQVGGDLYLGLAGDGFNPVIGRDEVRNPEPPYNLIPFTDESQLDPSYNENAFRAYREKKKIRTGVKVRVKPSDQVLVVYDLNRTRQASILEPSTFDGWNIQLNGIGPIGLEVSRQLVKVGVKNLSAYDSRDVDHQDPALSSFRAWDCGRQRSAAAQEVVQDQTLETSFQAYCETLAVHPKELGHVVINTSNSLNERRRLWDLVKDGVPDIDDKAVDRVGLYLDVQVRGRTGVLFCIDPANPDHREVYEAELSSRVHVPDAIIQVVSILASLTVEAVTQYALCAPAKTDDDAKRIRPEVPLQPFYHWDSEVYLQTQVV